jgi:Ni/Co efflux regulator RcnB
VRIASGSKEKFMKRALLASLVLAAGLLPVAVAAPTDRSRDGQRERSEQRDHRGEQRRDDRRDHRNDRGHDHHGQRGGQRGRHDAAHGYRSTASWGTQWRSSPQHYTPSRYRAPHYQPPRGYRAQQWQRGHHLPGHYRTSRYVVDYRHYRLAPPPYGYHYVRVDDHVVLAAIASGLISEVLFDLFYR